MRAYDETKPEKGIQMKLKSLGANRTVLSLGEGTDFETAVLFSYETPVAARTQAGNFRSSRKYSATTTRHVNAWVGENAKESPPEFFEQLANTIRRSA